MEARTGEKVGSREAEGKWEYRKKEKSILTRGRYIEFMVYGLLFAVYSLRFAVCSLRLKSQISKVKSQN